MGTDRPFVYKANGVWVVQSRSKSVAYAPTWREAYSFARWWVSCPDLYHPFTD